jgi:hypothetical protein
MAQIPVDFGDKSEVGMGDQTSVLTSGAAMTWVAVVTEGLGTAEASSSLES